MAADPVSQRGAPGGNRSQRVPSAVRAVGRSVPIMSFAGTSGAATPIRGLSASRVGSSAGVSTMTTEIQDKKRFEAFSCCCVCGGAARRVSKRRHNKFNSI
jgi:hypothetical protein